jgi:hypothetical protein
VTWIKTVPPSEASEELRDAQRKMRPLYPPEYGKEVESLKVVASRENGGGISDSHTLIPDALYHAFAEFGSLMSPELPLSRMQHEMIATVVSVANHCFY